MRSKSILTEARQIDTAVELIRLGARLQVLESAIKPNDGEHTLFLRL